MGGNRAYLLKHVQRLPTPGDGPAGDAGLLRRFVASRDEEAFGELVRRHGPIVLGVCRRVLGNGADAEDAFQATFLVLARKAESVRKGRSVGSWLFGVARHVATRARDRNLRRRRHERLAAADRAEAVLTDPAGGELLAVLDQELAALPDRYRAAVLACHVQRLTREGAARSLGWSLSTLRRRLERGEELLRSRLSRRVGAVVAVGTLPDALTAAVPSGLADATRDAAPAFAGGVRNGAAAALLADGVLGMMTRTRLQLVLGAAVVVAGMGGGAGLLWRAAQAAPDDKAVAAAPPSGEPAVAPPANERSRPGPPPAPAADDRIKPGDRLVLSGAPGIPDVPLDGVYRVEASGMIPLPVVYGGRVKVSGLTLEAAEGVIRDHLKKILRNPSVQVTRYDPVTDRRDPGGRIVALDERVQKLEEEVAELRKLVEELRKKPR